ncbi:MAG: hypothetical protein OXN17_00445 [Candidatus Poribacteria bacterium]|nr:hypothetical protein [Candidatus Poribacteria bacterium]MDE0506039.1 hypothetical protein [Candidatus Poribacteria bacterium]
MNQGYRHAACLGILFILFTLLVSGRAYAELYEGPPDLEELAMGGGGLTGGGLSFIDGDPFVRFQIQPDIGIGKVGFGLGFVLLYNPEAGEGENQILAEDAEYWDNPSTMVRAVRYVRYAHPRDPFYARLGELNFVTIGRGLIMSGYANYGRRGMSLNLRTESRRIGVESIVNDLVNPRIFGGRLFIRPLQGIKTVSILSGLELGATYLTDIKPDIIPDDYATGQGDSIDEDPLIALSVDVGFPLIESDLFRLDLYDELAFLNTQSSLKHLAESEPPSGNAIGIGLTFPSSLFKFEYRTFNEGFVPTVFDYSYQASAVDSAPVFLGLGPDVDKGKARYGYFSMFAWQPIPMLHLLGAFEDYNISYPKLYVGITESGIVQKMAFRAFYAKRDLGEPDSGYPDAPGSEDPSIFEDLFRLDGKSALIVRVEYELYRPIVVAIVREFRFRHREDADGVTDFETIQKTTIEVGLNLQF